MIVKRVVNSEMGLDSATSRQRSASLIKTLWLRMHDLRIDALAVRA